MRPRLSLSPRPNLAALLATGVLTLSAPAHAAPGTLRDFRLPPDQDAPPAQDTPQGPVAPDVPASTQVLRPSPTSTPAATPAPAPSASAVVQPLPCSTPRVVPLTVTPPAARPGPTRSAEPQATSPATDPSPELEENAQPSPAAAATAAASPLPSTAPRVIASDSEEGPLPWPWIIAALLALAGAGLTIWLLRRRAGTRVATTVPQVERPMVTPLSPVMPAAQPAEPASPIPVTSDSNSEQSARPGLELELEPQRLSLTLMNATLSYRLVLNNLGTEPLETLTISADMIAAHATLSREQQLSGPDANAMQVVSIARLEPGESRIVSGEFRLPFGQIMPIRQGNAALLFPLARFRVEGVGREPVTRTFLVAQPPERPGAGLQPFRLDLGPRVYPKLAQRAFA